MARIKALIEKSGEEIESILSDYRLGQLRSVKQLPGGQINTNYRLSTVTGEFLLRLSPRGRLQEEIEFEVSVLSHLAEKGVPVPTPVRRRDGTIIGSSDGSCLVLLEFLPGRTLGLDELTAETARQAGRLFGLMQGALSDCRPSGSKQDGDHPLTAELVQGLLAKVQDRGVLDLIRRTWIETESR
ncbi:phosphotransferase, partial [Rathayibacter tanaceti]